MASFKEIVLITLIVISVAILFLDRSFFKEFMEYTYSGTTTEISPTTVAKFANISETLCVNKTETVVVEKVVKDSSGMNKTDWFQGKLWQQSRCFEVDHICHSTGRWWYKNVPDANARQPNFSYATHKQFGAKVGYPSRITVRPETDVVKNLTCPYSPFPNHLILYALYNEMLGEFYARLLFGFGYILQHQENLNEFLQGTQVYLQLYNFDRNLLDSQHAFMAPFIFHQLHDFKELLQSTTCSCAERMIFCGYSQERGENEIVLKADAGISIEKFDGVKKEDPAVISDLRNMVRQRVILENPLIQEDIAAFRRSFLESKGVKDSFDDWKIVGFTQRTGRRRWGNIHLATKMCEEKLRLKRIVCMVVNVEEPQFHPALHVVAHAALDGIVGIHGAQLTDAIWMKPGAVVVEMLTFLPSGVKYGDWTREVRKFTPLGVIYHGTDLYHVGLPLKSDSVPQCQSKTGDQFTECVRGARWDSRDFTANPQDIEDVLTAFVHERPESCQAQKDLAGTYRFVLYNVQCDDGGGSAVHHFYWDKRLEDLDEYSSAPQEKA